MSFNIVDSMASRSLLGGGRSFFEGAPAERETFDRATGEPVTAKGEEVSSSGGDVSEVQESEAESASDSVSESISEVSEATGDVSSERGQPAPAFDMESVRRELEADLGKKAAKTILDKVVRPLTEQVGGVAAQTAQVRVERLVQKFGGVYSELKRPAALQAAISVAQTRQAKTGESDEKAMSWALKQIYGDRKAEMSAQVAGQISTPARISGSGDQKPDRMTVLRAAWNEYERLGGGAAGLQAAEALKKKHGG